MRVMTDQLRACGARHADCIQLGALKPKLSLSRGLKPSFARRCRVFQPPKAIPCEIRKEKNSGDL